MSKYEAVLGRKLTDEEKAKLAAAEDKTRSAPGATSRDPKAYDGATTKTYTPSGDQVPAARFMPRTHFPTADGSTVSLEFEGGGDGGMAPVQMLEHYNYYRPYAMSQDQIDTARAELAGPGYKPPVYPVSKSSVMTKYGPARIDHPSHFDQLAATGDITPEQAEQGKAEFLQQYPEPIVPVGPPPSQDGVAPSSAAVPASQAQAWSMGMSTGQPAPTSPAAASMGSVLMQKKQGK